jgi:hypothetical protein
MIELEFRNVDFYGGRKTGEPGEKPLKQGERINNKLNSHDSESGNRTIDRSGDRRASCHYSTPASRKIKLTMKYFCMKIDFIFQREKRSNVLPCENPLANVLSVLSKTHFNYFLFLHRNPS